MKSHPDTPSTGETPETDALNASHGDEERGWVVEYGEMLLLARALEKRNIRQLAIINAERYATQLATSRAEEAERRLALAVGENKRLSLQLDPSAGRK